MISQTLTANEALAKFIQRTNELKATLDISPPAVQPAAVVAPVEAIPAPKQKTKEEPKPKNFLILGGFVVFAFGFLAGAGLSFLF